VRRRAYDLLRKDARQSHLEEGWEERWDLSRGARVRPREDLSLLVAQFPRQVEQLLREIGRFSLEESTAVRQTLLAYLLAEDASWASVRAAAGRYGLEMCSKPNFFRRIVPLRRRIAALFDLDELELPMMRHLLCDGCPDALERLWAVAQEREVHGQPRSGSQGLQDDVAAVVQPGMDLDDLADPAPTV
jgi:hypothetical protein